MTENSELKFYSQDGPIMTIHPDGKITLGDGADPTEAAAACIAAMDGMIQNLIRNAAQKERNLIVAWLRNDAVPGYTMDLHDAGDLADDIERGAHHGAPPE